MSMNTSSVSTNVGTIDRKNPVNTGAAKEAPYAPAGFQPETPVNMDSSVRSMLSMLTKAGLSERLAAQEMPEEVQKLVDQILQNAFSLDSSLSQGVGNLLQGQKVSVEQLHFLAKIVAQLGAATEDGAGEFSADVKVFLANLKLLDGQSGKLLDDVALNKLALQLLEGKSFDEMPELLQFLLSQGTAGTGALPQPSEEFSFLKQLVKLFLPSAPQAQEGGQEQAAARPQSGAQAQGGSPEGTQQSATPQGSAQPNAAPQAQVGAPPQAGTAQGVQPQPGAPATPQGSAQPQGSIPAQSQGDAQAQPGTASQSQGGTQPQGSVQAQPGATLQPQEGSQAQPGTAQQPQGGAQAQQGTAQQTQESAQLQAARQEPGAAHQTADSAKTNAKPDTTQAAQNDAQPRAEGKATEQAQAPQTSAQQAAQNAAARPAQSDAAMQLMKQLAGQILQKAAANPALLNQKDAALLKSFVQEDGKLLSDAEAKQLQVLARMSEANLPAIIRQAAMRPGMTELPRLWTFVQLCNLSGLFNLPQAKLRDAGKKVQDFATILRRAVQNENETAGNQRSISFMTPLYLGENERCYPTYVHLFHQGEEGGGQAGERQKETWLRICLLTEHIGAAELIFHLYEGDQINLRVSFSEEDAVKSFYEYLPEMRAAFAQLPLELNDVKVGTIGG